MYEPHIILAWLLFGSLGVYLAVFWGSLLVSGCVSFITDGDKKIWNLQKTLNNYHGSYNFFVEDTASSGFLAPILYGFSSAGIVIATIPTGWLIPIIISTCIGIYISMLIARAVFRLNKKLDAHTKDKNAHK